MLQQYCTLSCCLYLAVNLLALPSWVKAISYRIVFNFKCSKPTYMYMYNQIWILEKNKNMDDQTPFTVALSKLRYASWIFTIKIKSNSNLWWRCIREEGPLKHWTEVLLDIEIWFKASTSSLCSGVSRIRVGWT